MKSPSTRPTSRFKLRRRFLPGCALAAVIACYLVVPAAFAADDYPGYTIRTIAVYPKEVFDTTKPEEDTWIGRGANNLHINTRPEVIRGELLFKEGEPYNKDLVEESARLLRRRSFLTEVNITVIPDHATREVDIDVETRDQWSFIIGTVAGGTSDNNVTGLDIGDKNFLGSGNSLGYSIRSDNSGLSHNVSFTGANIFYSRYDLFLGYDQVQFERTIQTSLNRPFYSVSTPAAHGFNYTRKEHDEAGLKWTSYRMGMYAGRADEFDDMVLRTSIRLSLGEETVNGGTADAKVQRDNKVLADIEVLDHPRDYAQETYMEKYRQVEDIPLGPRYTFTIGPRLTSIGSTSSDVSMGMSVSKWHKRDERDYFFASVSLSKKDDSFNEKYGDLSMRYYWRRFESQTFVLNTQITYAESETNRFRLGGNRGLRGYKTDEFIGRNQVLVNLEDRIFTRTAMFSGIVEPGFVIFADAGNTWNNQGGDSLTRLWTSVGAGLRLALLKAPGISLIRLDYGVPAEFNRPGVLTIGMEGFF